ncbi:hypothetical protein D5R40_02910 [Okeania hirsuta]|uniref:Uncharacterized protein n=1 Tax=Okeania hirsuta TaxID=1458930 RepID=A0A3N6PHG8_9CYAN|nr:hypothetical protein D5R40_02910 [Okeania hirsuta]
MRLLLLFTTDTILERGKYSEVVIEGNLDIIAAFSRWESDGTLDTQKLVKQPPYMLFSDSQDH